MKEEQKMLRVNYKDNDYWNCVYDACNALLNELNQSNQGTPLSNLLSLVDKIGIEEIKKSLVSSSFGFYITKKSVYDPEQIFEALESHRVYDYLTKQFDVSIVDEFDDNDDNSETCYLVFSENCVKIK